MEGTGQVDWVALTALVISVLSGIFAYMARRRAATEAEVRDLEQRVSIAETKIEMMPSTSSWTQMSSDISGIRGDVKTTSAQIEGLGAGLKRVERQIGLLMEHELKGSQQ